MRAHLGGRDRAQIDGGQGALVLAYALLPLAFKLLAALLLWRWRDSLEDHP